MSDGTWVQADGLVAFRPRHHAAGVCQGCHVTSTTVAPVDAGDGPRWLCAACRTGDD